MQALACPTHRSTPLAGPVGEKIWNMVGGPGASALPTGPRRWRDRWKGRLGGRTACWFFSILFTHDPAAGGIVGVCPPTDPRRWRDRWKERLGGESARPVFLNFIHPRSRRRRDRGGLPSHRSTPLAGPVEGKIGRRVGARITIS